ncbi:DEAD/DEAH box helicase [Pseudochryseolinea flava]|uniref:ATP-dependent helicase n=1 Tax=Pseudochryseolinea flava TaxID=2059302 RepID=A0A364Y3C0_9BACT|nr:DEAD/DEAH box helicase [Pseudochryseolinea flava]RAW00509.1 ATP-dependent helicase [Pseudochryseolinea flava]
MFEKSTGDNTHQEFKRIAEPGKEALFKNFVPDTFTIHENQQLLLVIGKHRYYDLISTQLILCEKSANNKIKAPFEKINPMDWVWKENQIPQLKFYLAVIRFQNVYQKSQADIQSLKALISNPLKLQCYAHDHRISDKITTKSISPVEITQSKLSTKVIVTKHVDYYTVHCEFNADNTRFALERISINHEYFICVHDRWYLCADVNMLQVISYFIEHGPVLTLSYDTFKEFKHDVLNTFELYVTVELTDLTENTGNKRSKSDFSNVEIKKIIYLSNLDNYIAINPVIQYGHVEVPVLSKKQIYFEDDDGKQFKVERQGALEDDFIALLLKQHSDFNDQLSNPLLYFYLHKAYFLDQHQFLRLFDDWQAHNIAVFGFSELKGNKFNRNRGNITMRVSSGVNWFNTDVNIQFGDTRATLSQLKYSLRNKSRYIQLDDGTIGIIPQEWIEKFKSFFRVAEVDGDHSFRISKTNYSFIQAESELVIDSEAKKEIASLEHALNNIIDIPLVPVPLTLQASLRHYQHQGVSWLNLLDDLKFGGCLADDMGLGKTIQVIAFILHLKEKHKKRTHLIVAPTTLLFSWKAELEKFAPGLKVHIQHGTKRINVTKFISFDVVLTSYGIVAQDIQRLAQFNFSYVILDEAQNIKNYSSQRHKAVSLLKCDNRLILSGTPFENNVFDLFSLFSFACPGLLGTRQHFRDTYGIAIMKYKQKRASKLLQKKIAPFLLRRTKDEVARELPEKTEMILYCQMDVEQTSLYKQEEKKFRDYISAIKQDELLKHSLHILKGLTRLRQICNSPALLKEDAVHTTQSAKIDLILDKLTAISPQHKVLVFSQFVSMLDLIAAGLDDRNIPYTTLTGKTKNRKEVVKQFNDDTALRVFLISLKTGGTGLNLTAADYVFIVDPWWNPAVENQAIDRAYRIGQEQKVVAVRFICKNSIEEKIVTLQESKASMSKVLMDTKSPFPGFQTKESLLDWIDH